MMISHQGLTDLCPPKYHGIIQQLKIKAASLNSSYDQANFSPFTQFLKTWEKLTQVFASNDMANYLEKREQCQEDPSIEDKNPFQEQNHDKVEHSL